MGQSIAPNIVKDIAVYIHKFIDEYVIKNPGTYNGSKGSYGHDLNMYFNRKVQNIDHLHTAVPLILYFWGTEETDKLMKYINELKAEGWIKTPNTAGFFTGKYNELMWNLYYALKVLKDKEND